MPMFDAWLRNPDLDLAPVTPPWIVDGTLPPAVVLRRRTREPRGRSRRRTAVAYDWVVGAWRAHEEVRRFRQTGRTVPVDLAERAARVAAPEPEEDDDGRQPPTVTPDLGVAPAEGDQRRVLRALAHRAVRRQTA